MSTFDIVYNDDFFYKDYNNNDENILLENYQYTEREADYYENH